MSRRRVLYFERYDGFGVLTYPDELFDLAVVWSGKKVFVRPIIELPNGDCYFLYQGEKVNPYAFDLLTEEIEPDWVYNWLTGITSGGKIEIDLSNLKDSHLLDFRSMLERKREHLTKWLLVK